MPYARAFGAALVLSMSAGLVSPAQAVDYLVNGTFEASFVDFSNGQVAGGWEPCYRPSLGSIQWSSYNFGIADAGLTQKVTSLPAGGEAGICQRVTGLTPGMSVKFSAYAYRRNTDTTLYLGIDGNNSLPAGSLPSRVTSFPSTVYAWVYQEVTATVGSGGAVAVYLWGYQPAAGVAFYFNNASLAEAPAVNPVTNLSAGECYSDAVKLSWTGPQGVAAYQIRCSALPIDAANWNAATPVTGQKPPMPVSGAAQSSWVRGLAAGQRYYFAIRCEDASGRLSAVSSNAMATTASPGAPPYWAVRLRDNLNAWYTKMRTDAEDANTNVGATADKPSDSFSWYYGGLDPDCEHNPTLAAILQIVRDEWMLDFFRRLSNHVWDHTYKNTNIDSNTYRSTKQKVPTWNESHHIGELTWNGVTLMAVDYDNPLWLERAIDYCGHFATWVGYTGDAGHGGRHLHFKSIWFRGDEYDHSADRGPQSLVDTPEDRRLTRSPTYACWRDPGSRMPGGQLIKDWLYELDSASAEDAMKTDLGKPVGLLPGENRFDNHTIGGYSGLWWKMAASLGGTLGSSGEWWWDWGVGWVQSRDAYFELIDAYVMTGESKFIAPVRETIRHFSVDAAINNIPPQYMFINSDTWYKGPIFPWPDYNDPWGGYQYIINYLYRQVSGDTQFDAAWVGHATTLWQVMPPPGKLRCQRMVRSTLTWTGDNMETTAGGTWKANAPFFVAWKVTGDKEWLCRALDEDMGSVWTEAAYTGMPGVGINRLPDQPITWNRTNSNFAALVLSHSDQHVKWLTYNFDASDRAVQIWLWSLEPGAYVLRHGPDLNGDDQMDSVTDERSLRYGQRRTAIDLTLPAGHLEVFEITRANCPAAGDLDSDADGVSNLCDNCPAIPNADQADANGNGLGDVCEVCGTADADFDGACDANDNCPATWNPLQEDRDGDHVGDSCDACPGTRLGLVIDATGCPQPVPGDFDGDFDVDQSDFGHLQACFSGEYTPQIDPVCKDAELDTDDDVDGQDLAIFRGCMTGEGVPANAHCAD